MIKINDLVIINEFDRPCTRLIAIVSEIGSDYILADYICKDTSMGQCDEQPSRVTKIEDFGMKIDIDMDQGAVQVIQVGPSIAKYSDGSIRKWQPEYYDTLWHELRDGMKERLNAREGD